MSVSLYLCTTISNIVHRWFKQILRDIHSSTLGHFIHLRVVSHGVTYCNTSNRKIRSQLTWQNNYRQAGSTLSAVYSLRLHNICFQIRFQSIQVSRNKLEYKLNIKNDKIEVKSTFNELFCLIWQFQALNFIQIHLLNKIWWTCSSVKCQPAWEKFAYSITQI